MTGEVNVISGQVEMEADWYGELGRAIEEKSSAGWTGIWVDPWDCWSGE